jgi:hypothetical protein
MGLRRRQFSKQLLRGGRVARTADRARQHIRTARRFHIDRLGLGLPQEDGVLQVEIRVDRLPVPPLAQQPRRGSGLRTRRDGHFHGGGVLLGRGGRRRGGTEGGRRVSSRRRDIVVVDLLLLRLRAPIAARLKTPPPRPKRNLLYPRRAE